jgi:hypothetical protein
MATQTSSVYTQVPPRAVHIGNNRMAASIAQTVTNSASDELWLFPIPPRCLVTGGVIRGSLPSGVVATSQVTVKLGTKEDDDYFGTYTVSGTAGLPMTRLAIAAPVTVSMSDDYVPYQAPVTATVSGATTTATTSLSLYVLLEYVMPGNI